MTTNTPTNTTATQAPPPLDPQPAPPTREPMRRRLRRHGPSILALVAMTCATAPLLLLFLWMFLASFGEDFSAGIFPREWTLDHWSFLTGPLVLEGFTYPSIWAILRNSLQLALTIAILEVIIAVAAAYAISRLDIPGRQTLLYSAVLSHAFPPIVGLLASFYILFVTGLIGTLGGVILLKLLGNIPMSVWIMKGFFDKVPHEIEWAGSIDGASRTTILRRIVVPTVKPGIVAIGIFAFLSGWGEYVLVSVLIFDQALFTFPVVLQLLFEDTATGSYGVLTALATFYMLPSLLFYVFAQRSLMKLVF